MGLLSLFFVALTAATVVLKSHPQLRLYLHDIQQLRIGIHDDANFAMRYVELRTIQKTFGQMKSKGEYHLFRLLSERFSSKLRDRIDYFKLASFTDLVHQESNELVMDYGMNKNCDGLSFTFPAEFDKLFKDVSSKDLHSMVKDKSFDHASQLVHDFALSLFASEDAVRGMLLVNALQIYEEAMKVIYRYRTDVPELANLCYLNDSELALSSSILSRLRLLLGHWGKLRMFDFRTAYPVLASSHLILHYSLLMSLFIENKSLIDMCIENLIGFDKAVLSKLKEFQSIRTVVKKFEDMNIEAHVVPSSWTKRKGALVGRKSGEKLVLVTTDLKADLDLLISKVRHRGL